MLSKRQIEILLEYCNHTGEFFTASHFADQMDISLRTVQADMKEIRNELENETCMELISKTSQGSCIIVKDQDEFSAYVNSLYQEFTTVSLNYPTSRITQILLLLLNSHRAVTFSYMEEKYFIFRSTLLNDLKKVEKILKEFHLELMRSNNRVLIDGMEINKRHCLREQNLYLAHAKNDQGVMYIDELQIAKIKNVLMDTFVEHKYYIMDTDFNNLVLFLNIMIWRMGDGFYIQPNEIQDNEFKGSSYELARDVFEGLGHKFFLRITEEEVAYLAVYLKGLGNNQDEGTISPEMDAFIMECFEKIRDNYGYDFTNNVNLRITLALHTLSLCVRLQYDMQMKNDMLEYIRESFPLGYDIGAFFGYQLTQKYGKKVSEDEVGLLAVHFYSSMMEQSMDREKLKVLVFTSMKLSSSILLKQILLRWFSEEIGKIDFIHEQDMDMDMLDDYDIFLTTEKGQMYENNLAMYINPFPEQKDYFNIKLNIDGFRNIDDVIELFHPELFCSVRQTRKEKALETLCQLSSDYFELEGLYEQVVMREEIGSTFFTKHIAMAHPVNAVSSDTFISVMFSKKAITWDEDDNHANLIMLLHIGKSNPQAFKLWEYMAKIFANRTFVDQLELRPDYDHFIQLVKESLETGINESEL